MSTKKSRLTINKVKVIFADEHKYFSFLSNFSKIIRYTYLLLYQYRNIIPT